MAPILGIYASQISGHLFAPSGAYDSIATTTVGAGGAASITFSSIPATYTHLQVRFIARGTDSVLNNIGYTFNNDTTANYSDHTIFADGSSVSAFANTNTSSASFISLSNSSRATGAFSAGVFDLLDYANTNKFKTVRALSGREDNSTGAILFSSGGYRSTSAVSTIAFFTSLGNFAQHSSFALYGIKGS